MMLEQPTYKKIKNKTYLHLYRNKWLCTDIENLDSRYFIGELDKNGVQRPSDRVPFHRIKVK